MANSFSIGGIEDSGQTKSVYQIGTDFFWIEIWMYNYDISKPPYQLPFAAVDQLCIEETLYDWNITGYITIENWNEILERGTYASKSGSSIQGYNQTPTQPGFLNFRTDGRNLISFKIYPYIDDETGSKGTQTTLKAKDWVMSFDCSIYDIQDTSTDNFKKLRTFYFKDIRHQIFSERYLQWSSGNIARKIKELEGTVLDLNLAYDSEKSVPAGLILKHLILNANSGTLETMANVPLKMAYDETGSIDKPNLSILNIDDSKWDGGDPESKILYNSPANSTILDDINYILKYATSSNTVNPSPLILQVGSRGMPGEDIKANTGYTGKIDKRWTLIPLADYYKNSEKLQKEKIIIRDYAASDATVDVGQRAFSSMDPNAPDMNNFNSPIASVADNYHFAPMVAVDDAEFANSPVVQFKFNLSQYEIGFANNKITDVIENATLMGKSGLFNFLKNNKEAQILLNTNQTKLSGLNTQYKFVTQPFVSSNLTGMQMLKNLVYKNQALYLQIPGLIIRKPGNFLHIYRPIPEKNSFDDRFFGQWLTVKVVHFFTKNSYTNDIICTKIDSYSKIYETGKNNIAP